MNKPRLHYIGIGGQKCATSWLSKCISEHPELDIFPGKEIHFFSETKKYNKGLEFYTNFFKDCDFSKKVGEFSTTYLNSFKAADRIKEYYPDIKIIVSIRNPIDRAVSHVRHLLSTGKINYFRNWDDPFLIEQSLIERGYYGKYVEYYIKLFGRENILIILFDDISNKPDKVVKDIYTFLDVDNSFKPSSIDKKYNSSNARSFSAFWLLNNIYLKYRNNSLFKISTSIFKKMGINSVLINNFFDKLGKVKIEKIKFKRSELIEIYRDDIKKTERITKRDLSDWYTFNEKEI
ncbi:MAG: hypothetical protein GF349_01970 [Candidatus Magasanikbacteria bacterium]|nr:hypothetical protein [Candidatus Magasanikbacteria bacterium]